MGLKLKETEKESSFELLDPGVYDAVCVGIYDLGPQRVEYMGQEKVQNKVRLQFEVPDERVEWTDKEGVEHEGPKTVSKTYTASLYSKAKLCEHLEGWRGRQFTDVEKMGFDLSALAGKPCRLMIQHRVHQHSGNTWADIAAISPPGKVPAKSDTTPVIFDFDNHSQAELEALPEWMQEKIADGKAEVAASRPSTPAQPEASSSDNDDDIPF